MTLKIVGTPLTLDEELTSLGLENVELKGKAGQHFWTVGNDPRCDIVIPKANISLGYQFAVLFKDGKYFVKDLSNLSRDCETTFKLPKDEEYPVKEGDVLNFAGAVVYSITEMNAENLKLQKVEEIEVSTKELDDEEESEMGEGTSLGRLKKNDITIAHQKVSGEHCTFTPTGITDISSKGTYLNLRNAT